MCISDTEFWTEKRFKNKRFLTRSRGTFDSLKIDKLQEGDDLALMIAQVISLYRHFKRTRQKIETH
jgi:hypothetical protein